MKFFQVFTMIVMVLATVGVIGESGRGKHVYICAVSTSRNTKEPAADAGGKNLCDRR